MFGFRPLRCLPACPLSHSLSLTECSLWHSLFTTGQTVRYLARTKSHAHSRTKMKVYVDLRICCCSPAFHLHLFRAYPVPWVSFQPSNKVLSLSFSVCGPSLAFFRDFGYHGRYSAHGYMCQTTPPLPSFPLFTFSISTTIRNMAAQFASQPRCTAHNSQPTVHIPHPAIHMSHSTPHMSQVWSSRESKQFIKLRRQQQQ